MKKLIRNLASATVVLAFSLLIFGFRLLGPVFPGSPPATPPYSGYLLPPHLNVVFSHWDLREFPGCEIPYSHHNPTTDTTAAAARAEVDAAFQLWENVTPAHIAFVLVPPGPGALCPLLRDGNNMLGWHNGACGAGVGDDVCLPAGGCACWAAVAANADIISGGPDDFLQSQPNSCCDDLVGFFNANAADQDTMFIFRGPNGNAETQRVADDVVLRGAMFACNSAVPDTVFAGTGVYLVVTDGANGAFDTQLNNCCDDQAYYNAVAGEWRIRDGGNTTVNSTVGTQNVPNGVLGLTAIFYNTSTGVIEESDIAFNDTNYTWVITADQAATPTGAEVQTVAAHEIGHFIGFHHVDPGPDFDLAPHGNFPGAEDTDDDGDGILDTPMMDSPTETAMHHLHDDDWDACNFNYNPDLGDAPDAPYSSLVHGGAAGRTLNGMTLEVPRPGPEHIFGRKTRLPARNYTYEWIGYDVNSECESEQVNADPYDDGIILHTNPAVRGNGFAVEVQISTAADAQPTPQQHDYVTTPMYLNIWADWNGNGEFEAGPPEQLAGPGDAIQQAGLYTRGGIVPFAAVDPVWIRIRLDWGEDAGAAADRDGTLDGPLGAAQFGEVSDTLVPVIYGQQRYDLGDLDPCNYPTLDMNPAHAPSGCVWLGGCITAELSPNFFNLDPCDDGVVFVGTPWEPCTPVTIEVTVTVGTCSPFDIFYFNFWKDGNLDRDFCDATCAPEWCVMNEPVFAAGSPWIFTFPDPGGYGFPPYSLAARARLTSIPVSPVPGAIGPCDSATCWWMPPIDSYGEVEDYDLTDQQLDVELASFDAEPGDNLVTLRWTTASETNNDHFELTRDGEIVHQTAGAGSSVSELNYEWADDAVTNGRTYTYTLFGVNSNGAREELSFIEATPNFNFAVITEYALHQNYPNPFNPETQIVYDVKEAGYVSLKVFNLMGQEVADLVHRSVQSGRQTVSFRADNLPSGIYLYRLTVNDFADQKKMLLIR